MSTVVDDLPEGWSTITLGELGWDRTDGMLPSDSPSQIFEVWSVPAFPTGIPENLTGKEIGSNKQRVQPGDVLLCKINPRINRVWIVGPKKEKTQIASTEWVVFRIKHLDPRFLMHRMREGVFREAICSEVSGVGGSLTRVRPQVLRNIEISVPPLPEQRRIVAKIEALQARSRKAREALEAIPPLLEQFRQSVLAAAFRGDLTADWREQHPDVEPASVLLERIRSERRRKWEEAELAKFKAKGKVPRDDSWKEKYIEPEPVHDEGLPELPDGWCWTSAEEVVDPDSEIVYGIVQPGPQLTEGIPYVRGCDIQDGEIQVDQLLRTSKEIAQRYERASLRGGDVLLGIIRATKVAIVPSSIDGANITQGTARFRPSSAITTDFLAGWLDTPFAQEWLHDHYRGIDMPGLNLRDVRRLPVPLAPRKEQSAISNCLRKWKSSVLSLQDALKLASSQVKCLDQSILAKAFRGELVPQDPNDEPASVLLERIRAERADGTSSKSPRGCRKRPSTTAE